MADPDALCPGTLHTPASYAVAAPTANKMTFAAHEVAYLEILDVQAEFHDLTDKLVADDQRDWDVGLCPRVPCVDVQVRPTDAGP